MTQICLPAAGLANNGSPCKLTGTQSSTVTYLKTPWNSILATQMPCLLSLRLGKRFLTLQSVSDRAEMALRKQPLPVLPWKTWQGCRLGSIKTGSLMISGILFQMALTLRSSTSPIEVCSGGNSKSVNLWPLFQCLSTSYRQFDLSTLRTQMFLGLLFIRSLQVQSPATTLLVATLLIHSSPETFSTPCSPTGRTTVPVSLLVAGSDSQSLSEDVGNLLNTSQAQSPAAGTFEQSPQEAKKLSIRLVLEQNLFIIDETVHNHSFCIETMSTDWTSSSQAVILSKMSSVSTLSSSITHPICSFWMPNATSNFLGCLFHTNPSISRAKTFWANSSKLVTSASQILTSKMTIDLAMGLGFSAFLGCTLGFSTGLAGASSSAKGSKSSSCLGVSVFFTSAGLAAAAHLWITAGEKTEMKRYQQ